MYKQIEVQTTIITNIQIKQKKTPQITTTKLPTERQLSKAKQYEEVKH